MGTGVPDGSGGRSQGPDGDPPARDRARAMALRSGSRWGSAAERTCVSCRRTWTVHGVDIARTQLEACRRLHPSTTGRLAWAEAEGLPFADATFDACWSVGGFNYFRDHEAALREMRRVTRPGGPVVVADELPGLHRAGLGHLLGYSVP